MIKENLVTTHQQTDLAAAAQILQENKIEKLPVVDKDNHLVGLITYKDITKAKDKPMACKDEKGRLRVAAGVGVTVDTLDRMQALVNAGADAIVIDTAHGHSKGVIDKLKEAKNAFKNIDIVVGNIATGAAARMLVENGADAVKVGIGPGSEEHMTQAALAAVKKADVLVGYTVYLDLVRPLAAEKETYTTPMTQELERCRFAVEAAAKGRCVAMLCSGDAGVYGMAGPVLEMTERYPQVEVVVVPGVTAALSGAALLGAPLMNDFCVISLSDRLTCWETIRKRLRCAAEGDFAICMYNPASRQRRDHLKKACDILLDFRSPETPCGWVRKIGREGQ